MVTSTAAGTMIPLQAIWSGKTDGSLPQAKIRKPAEKEGHTWVHGGERHWSNLAAMKDWVVNNLAAHVDDVKKKKKLPASQVAILLIDCWSVHRSQEFLDWMRKNYPYIRMFFIPGGCTGKFQPADVGLQRILKHIIKTAALEFMVAEAQRQLKKGAQPIDVTIPTGIGLLRDQSVAWQTKAYKYFVDHPGDVLRSWLKCETECWNLSYECITSDRARSALDEKTEDDVSFVLSLPTEREEDSDGEVVHTEGQIYDDDTSLLADVLAGLHLRNESPQGVKEIEPGVEAVAKTSALEEEWSDRDGGGETDPEIVSSDPGPAVDEETRGSSDGDGDYRIETDEDGWGGGRDEGDGGDWGNGLNRGDDDEWAMRDRYAALFESTDDERYNPEDHMDEELESDDEVVEVEGEGEHLAESSAPLQRRRDSRFREPSEIEVPGELLGIEIDLTSD